MSDKQQQQNDDELQKLQLLALQSATDDTQCSDAETPQTETNVQRGAGIDVDIRRDNSLNIMNDVDFQQPMAYTLDDLLLQLPSLPKMIDRQECIPMQFDTFDDLQSSFAQFFTTQNVFFTPTDFSIVGDYYCVSSASRVQFQLSLYCDESKQLLGDMRRVNGCGISFARFFAAFFQEFSTEPRTLCTFTPPPLLSAGSLEQQHSVVETCADREDCDEESTEMNTGLFILENLLLPHNTNAVADNTHTTQDDASSALLPKSPLLAAASAADQNQQIPQGVAPADQVMLARGFDSIALPVYALVHANLGQEQHNFTEKQLASFSASFNKHVRPFVINLLQQLTAYIEAPRVQDARQPETAQMSSVVLDLIAHLDNLQVSSSFYQLLFQMCQLEDDSAQQNELRAAVRGLPYDVIQQDLAKQPEPASRLQLLELQRLGQIIAALQNIPA